MNQNLPVSLLPRLEELDQRYRSNGISFATGKRKITARDEANDGTVRWEIFRQL